MRILLLSIITSIVFAQTAQVQIVHNSPSPTVDIYVDSVVALVDVAYRASTGLVDLPINTEVGIVPAYGELGNAVSNLFSGIEGPGYKSINWDATNNNGDLVSSGMYFYKLQVGESFEIKRMMYLK